MKKLIPLVFICLVGCAGQTPAPTQITNNTYTIANSSWDYVYGYQAGMKAERQDNFRFLCGEATTYYTVQMLIDATTNYIVMKDTPTVIEPPQ